MLKLQSGTGFPAGPVVLIGLGVVFLLNNLGLLRISQVMKFWPVLLIALGLMMLKDRMGGRDDAR
ncbi:MAG: hypothetical protein FJW39_22930 [Acidobacteria bacterium]|nr:hypothetical protein [Acidobacteriota bacterium]